MVVCSLVDFNWEMFSCEKPINSSGTNKNHLERDILVEKIRNEIRSFLLKFCFR